MSTKTEEKSIEQQHHELPLVQAFVALLVITIVEVGLGYMESSTINTVLLLSLTIAKAAIVGAVFMEIAYNKDTGRIITYVFIIPLISVFFLLFAIGADWRSLLG